MNTEVSYNHTQTEIIQLLLQLGLTSGGSFAIWRKPKSKKLEMVLDETASPQKVELNLEGLPLGLSFIPLQIKRIKKHITSRRIGISALN
ncbi:hypothetical protein V8V91_24905 [Algoriphagus halophilus]|uniref:hypothetical protein n=1 Tax=Algoriphagus halophilus TaxID=226505 RepID=UPI00358F860F